MRKIMVFMLAAALLVSFGSAIAQEKAPKSGEQPSTTMPSSSMPGGQPQPQEMGQGSISGPQLMQQMQDTMQQMQGVMRKPRMTNSELKQLQDMLNQMQGMMNQMQIMTMMQMCGPCPMMKQTPPSESTPPQTPSGSSTPGSPPEAQKNQ